mgnify:FL=1
MLLNLSNHPSDLWSENQKKIAVKSYGAISDLPFPAISPEWDTEQVMDLAEEYLMKVTAYKDILAVHIQGEFTFTFALVHMLQNANIKCIVSTTKRIVHMKKDGSKISRFKFIQFRDYPLLH